MKTAGCLRGGRKIWALAENIQDDHRFEIGGDIVGRMLLLATSYDRSINTIIEQTSVCVVCGNTLRMAYGRESGSRITVPHLSRFDAAAVKEEMLLDDSWDGFTEGLTRLAEANITEGAAREYFTDVFYPDPEAVNEKARERRVDQIYGHYLDSPGQDLPSRAGTMWGAVNAVTYYADHEVKSRDEDIRRDKAWFGSGAKLKDRAFERALEMVS